MSSVTEKSDSRDLKNRLPDLFRGCTVCEYPESWGPAVEGAALMLDTLRHAGRDVRVARVWEKFGRLRFDIDGAGLTQLIARSAESTVEILESWIQSNHAKTSGEGQ